MGTVPAFGGADQALDMVHAGLGHLAAADATAMTTDEQARYLRGLEQADAILTAARATVLAGSPRPRASARTRTTARGPS